MAMEFCAVAKDGVHIFPYESGAGLPEEATVSFPPVPTADGCVWSADGNLLGLVNAKSGGVSVYNAAGDYEKVCEVRALLESSLVRMFYFSPLGNHIVTYERFVKDAGDNVGLWDAKTDGVQILKGIAARDEPLGKIEAPHIMAFEVAPKGAGSGPPHVAVVTPEAKGAPARCSIYSLDEPDKVKAGKSFYKVQKAQMKWNNTGSSLLVLTSMETDDTGKAYYGSTNLYFMRADGEEDAIVAAQGDGTVHDFQWCPTQDEFLLLHGDLPCQMNLHDGKKAKQKMEFGQGHRNTIRWNQFGRFVVLGGFGQLAGDVDFWDKTGRKKLGSIRMDCCVVSDWSPGGRDFLSATTAPRMRMDNKIEIYDYCGNKQGSMPFAELMWAGWRPRPRGAFQDRPPSPERKLQPAAGTKAGAKPAAKQAYRPPGARGGGGLSALLRSELGSTSAETSSTASKTFGGRGPANLPPGMAPPSDADQAGASRNARKKKGKETKEAAEEAAKKERLAAALAPVAAATAPVEFSPPPRPAKAAPAAEAEAPREAPAAAAAAAAGGDNPEVEKKVRALQKKLRDISKLKEKPAKDLDVLQKEKLKGEADLLKQLRDLGVDM